MSSSTHESTDAGRTKRLFVWGEPAQAEMVREAADEAELEIPAAGGPDPDASARFAEALGVERVDDLRAALQRDDIDLVWLAARDAIGNDDRAFIRERGLVTISSEPRPGAFAEMQHPDEAATTTFAPLMRVSPGMLAAMDVLDEFGERRCLNIAFRGAGVEGSLFARLFDAMDIASLLCGDCEQIDASIAARRSSVPESPRNLTGHLTLNMRFPDHVCACVSASDQAGRWSRGVTLLGEGGCLRIDDVSFEWIAPDGRTIDKHESGERLSPGKLVGRQVRRKLEQRDVASPGPDNARLLALCEATRLSCRTGQSETPGKMLEMLSRP